MGAAMHRIHEIVLERSGQRLPADFDEIFHARVFEDSAATWSRYRV